MLIVMDTGATPRDIAGVLSRLAAGGGNGQCYRPREVLPRQTLIAVAEKLENLEASELETFPGVAAVHPGSGYWLVSRKRQPLDTVVEVKGRIFGGDHPPVLIAGACAVESEDQLFRCAEAALEAGAGLLRGGAYKPRTSPYSFQGLGEPGLEMLARVRDRLGIPIVTELRDVTTLDLFVSYDIDVIQVGARNMQNFELLRRVGEAGLPVLLKRGPACSIDDWLSAAEYVMLAGNPRVILCERGITAPLGSKTRYLLDVAAIPVARRLTHLPVIADPSHAAGDREFVAPLARAAVAAGAHGLLVEVHVDPDRALCDGAQSLTPAMLKALVEDLRDHGYSLDSSFQESAVGV